MSVVSPAPSPGWYRDPSGEPLLRWWAGNAWSEHTHPYPVTAAGGGATLVGVAHAEPLESELEDESDEDDDHIPFAAQQAGYEAIAYHTDRIVNRWARRGRSFGLGATIFFVASLALIYLGFVVDSSGALLSIGLAASVVATLLAIVAIVLSSIGLARSRIQGGTPMAVAGLVLGIIFTFTFAWIGIIAAIVIPLYLAGALR